MSRYAPLLLILLVGCSRPAPPPPSLKPVPTATAGIDRGTDYLLKNQSPDGAWRSDVYATFKDGTSLTPLVLVSLQTAGNDRTWDARDKAAAWLAGFVRNDGSIDEKDGIPYPVYTAALSVIALSPPELFVYHEARDAWLNYLLDRQLTEANGWEPTDKQYGGWGYYPSIPKKPAAGQAVPAQHLLESNLSATRFALEAIQAAELGRMVPNAKLPAIVAATARFVATCKNSDSGYHFIYDDPVRNKAGVKPIPSAAPIYSSYGSATADGLLCEDLLAHLSGKKPTDTTPGPWFATNFQADHHPGDYAPTYELNRDAVYFYYAAAATRLFQNRRVKSVGSVLWFEQFKNALTAKQLPNGSWENRVELVRENDPILSTAYALMALAECRTAAAVP